VCKNGCKLRWNGDRQRRRSFRVSRQIDFFPREPCFRFHRPQNFWREIKKRADADQENDKRNEGIRMYESESAQDRGVFPKT
jgi:hypothetical protein